MPVSAQTLFNTYTGNGVTTSFAYSFRIIDNTQIDVYVDEVLQTSGYTVSGVGNAGGGNVVFTIAPAGSTVIRIVRVTVKERDYDYAEGGGLSAMTLDDDQDYQTMMIQELSEQSLRQDVSSGNWDAQGKRILNVGFPEEYSDAASVRYVDQLVADVTYAEGRADITGYAFTGDGSEDTFSIPAASLTNPAAYMVTLDGAIVVPTDYTINTTAKTIVFGTAPGNGVEVLVRILGFSRVVAEPGLIATPAYGAPSGVVCLGNVTDTTVGAAGGASALPATPSGYLEIYIGSTKYKIPYFAD